MRDEAALKRSSCPVGWEEMGVGWLRWTGLEPALDHMEAWFADGSCELPDNDGKSLPNKSANMFPDCECSADDVNRGSMKYPLRTVA
jgi:hypothetical protein